MYYHKEVLKQLMPIELSGVFLKDLELEGKQLDIALYNVEKLKEQIFPDTADIFLDYIRVYDIEVNQQDTIQTIREKIITKMNERGSLRKKYYINLAKKMDIQSQYRNFGHSCVAGIMRDVKFWHMKLYLYSEYTYIIKRHITFERVSPVREKDYYISKKMKK